MYSIVVVAISAVALWDSTNTSMRQIYDRNWITNITGLFMKWLDMWTMSKYCCWNLLYATVRKRRPRPCRKHGDSQILPKAIWDSCHNSGGAVQYIEFLTQVGDLAYSINNQNMSGKGLTEEQYKLIEQLHGFAVTLGKAWMTFRISFRQEE